MKENKGKASFRMPVDKGKGKKRGILKRLGDSVSGSGGGPNWMVGIIVLIAVFLLATFLLPRCADAGEIDLSWQAPTTNEDGSTLTDLGGYTVYWYDTAGGFSNPMGNLDVGNVTTTTITVPSQGIVYMVVTAYDTSGNVSGPSNEVSADFLASSVPTSLSVDGVRK